MPLEREVISSGAWASWPVLSYATWLRFTERPRGLHAEFTSLAHTGFDSRRRW
jgi:hypothetical protein